MVNTKTEKEHLKTILAGAGSWVAYAIYFLIYLCYNIDIYDEVM